MLRISFRRTARALSSSAADAAAATLTHEELRATVRSFVALEVNPYVDEWEHEGIFPARQLFKKMGDAGLLGLTKPVEYGGLGLPFSYSLVMAEETGGIRCGGVPMAIGVQTDMATPALARFGSDELRSRILAPTVAGDLVACLGVSEVGAGSDVSATVTTAVLDRDGAYYTVNGGKMWTTNGTQADWMCTLVNTEGAGQVAPHANKTLLVVPMDAAGVSVAPRLDKLGMRSSDTTQVTLEDVRVPAANVIGEPGRGFAYQMLQFQEERLFAAANVLLPLRRCLGDTAAYCRERRAFGKPLLANQTVRFRLAELETELELLRSLVWRAADAMEAGEDVTKLASMAKLKAGRLSREVTDSCLQYWGGMGFMSETEVSRAYRDLRLISIGGGADEVMLEIISKLTHGKVDDR